MSKLRAFLPSIQQVKQLYALQVFLVYSWVILLFFYDLPRWMNFLSQNEISVVFAYAMVFALLDSLAFFLILFLPSLLLYKALLEEKFESVIGTVAIIGYGWVIFLRFMYQRELVRQSMWMSESFPFWVLLAISSTILFGVVVYRSGALRKAMSFICERAQVFLLLYLPLSIIGVIVVAIRNWN
jgi:hypothetical protein